MRRLFQDSPKMPPTTPVPIVPMLYKRRFSLYNDMVAFRPEDGRFLRCSYYIIPKNQMERG